MPLLLLSACREEVMQGVRDTDIGKIVTSLEGSGIQTHRTRQSTGTWSVSVPNTQAGRALEVLESKRLNRNREITKGESSLFLSPREQDLKYERELSRVIEETLLALEGVYEAKVHLTLPVREGGFGVDRVKHGGSGSVLVIASPEITATAEEISQLVAGAAGISSQSVTVLVKSGRHLSSDEKLQQTDQARSLYYGLGGITFFALGFLCLKFQRPVKGNHGQTKL